MINLMSCKPPSCLLVQEKLPKDVAIKLFASTIVNSMNSSKNVFLNCSRLEREKCKQMRMCSVHYCFGFFYSKVYPYCFGFFYSKVDCSTSYRRNRNNKGRL